MHKKDGERIADREKKLFEGHEVRDAPSCCEAKARSIERGNGGRALERRGIEYPYKTGSAPLGDGAHCTDLEQFPRGADGQAGAADDIVVCKLVLLIRPQRLIEIQHPTDVD